MFSMEEKKHIAEVIEKTLLDLKHPEMPTEKPKFVLHVDGKESWLFANIAPNWTFNENNKPGVNPWNEEARDKMKTKTTDN